MTLGTIFRNVLGPSSSQYYDYPAHAQTIFSEKNGGGEYYPHRSHKKTKGKSKSDKKHAILSALSLLAFLFFLNILQNCIREQSVNRGTVMMFAPTGPTAHQSKEPNLNQPPQPTGNGYRKKRSAGKNTTDASRRKSRTLLGITEPLNTRQVKFIRNYSSVNNWTRELSEVSDKDLEDQRLKTLNFPLYWKNNRFTIARETTQMPILLKRRMKKRERTTTTTPEVLNRTTLPINTTTRKVGWIYTNPANRQIQNKDKRNYTQTLNSQNNGWRGYSTPLAAASTAALQYTATTETVATTPRNRRSDYGSTPRTTDYDDYDRYEDQTPLPAAPAVGLDLNTYQTFPVYNYYGNHRHHQFRENQTVEADKSESSKPDQPEIDRIHNEVVRVTTEEPPFFYPTKIAPQYNKHPYYERIKYRNRYPNHQGFYQIRNQYPVESRYRYSPYRKASNAYEPPHYHDPLRDDYHVVLAKYPQDEEPGFDVMKFLWSMLTTFAKPLTKLVPSLAKESQEEPQCYDLIVCEAQRVSKFMGPTAEALTTTLGTLLTWAATEETRQTVVDALNSGRENTCQQQIRDCEDRSGGKSAMTVIAQVMEMRLR